MAPMGKMEFPDGHKVDGFNLAGFNPDGFNPSLHDFEIFCPIDNLT